MNAAHDPSVAVGRQPGFAVDCEEDFEGNTMLQLDEERSPVELATSSLWQSAATLVAATLVLLSQSSNAVSQPDVYRTHCASKHAAAVMLIEEQHLLGLVPEPILAEQAFVVISARNACMNGQLPRALSLYESVLLEVQKAQD